MRRITLCTLAALALVVPAAHAAPVPPPAAKSDNVTWLTSLDEPGTISARFRDGKMYLSHLRGLSIYDVSSPRQPVKLGSLSLPHFENEDIDVGHVAGRTIALISNDPSEGKGRLHVIDVTDPSAPREIGSIETGSVDVAQDIVWDFFSGFLPLPANPVPAGTGHTASCVADCRYVYLAGTRFGIDVIDLSDPSQPKKVKNLPLPEVTNGVAIHDVQFDRSGLAWFAGYGGTGGYDISDPLNPRRVFITGPEGRSRYIDEPVNDGSTLNDFIHHNSMRVPTQAGADSDLVVIVEEDYTRPGCSGGGSVQTWRIGPDGVLENLDAWAAEEDPSRGIVFCSAHYFDERAGLLAQGFYEQGTRFLDISQPDDIRQVGYWIPRFTETWGALYPPTDPSGEVVYSLDMTRGIDVLELTRPQASALSPARATLNRAMPTVRPRPIRARWGGGYREVSFGLLCRLPRLGIG